jgi:hypothetical protein
MAENPEVAAICQRADDISQLGTYIGLFEWCAVALSKKRPVTLWFALSPVDILQVFCPSAARMVSEGTPLNIVATVVDEGLVLMTQGNLPWVSHYLAAMPIQETAAGSSRIVPQPASTLALVADSLKKSVDNMDTSEGTRFLVEEYRAIGLSVVSTATQGDCGPDAACALESRSRNPGEWKVWREELRLFIRQWALSPEFSQQCRDCFIACQEVEARPPISTQKASVVVELDPDAAEADKHDHAVSTSEDEHSDKESDSGISLCPSLFPASESEYEPDGGDNNSLEDLVDDDLAARDEGLDFMQMDLESDVGALGAQQDAEATPAFEKALETAALGTELGTLAAHADVGASAVQEARTDVKATLEKILGHSLEEPRWEEVERFRVCRTKAMQRIAKLDERRMSKKEKCKKLTQKLCLPERIKIGELYLAFSSAARRKASRSKPSYLKDFLVGELGWPVSQKNKNFVVRCAQVAIKNGANCAGSGLAPPDPSKILSAVPGGIRGAQHRATRSGQKRRKDRFRILSFQGRPHLAPVLSELLFQWFVDIRGSIKGRLPTKTVLYKARQLAVDYFSRSLSMGDVPRVPAITKAWVLRWKRRHGVSFRKPNRRFKVTYKGLLVRLKIFWLNNIRVRYFAMRFSELKREKKLVDSSTLPAPSGDIGQRIDQVDQKGWHHNEAGSKKLGTLEIKGTPKVSLKENHAATRLRSTIFTWCSNNTDMLSEHNLPLEICFKFSGGGVRCIDSLELPRGAYSVQGSTSGSYKEVHVFLYLQRHLPVFTPERKSKGDWRILYLDLYAGHMSRRIWDLCWNRGYLLLYHGGGCTGLTQLNDVWLHWLLEQRLLEVEQAQFNAEMLLRPTKIPSVDRQSMINNVAAVWETLPHNRSVSWAKKTGVSIAVDGTEDTTALYSAVQ